MPPKKQNAFYYYMKDFKNSEEAKGVRFPNGLRDVSVAASSSWRSMSLASKDKYEAMAKSTSRNPGEKYNTLGVSLTQIEHMQREEALCEEMENNEISQSIEKAIIDDSLLDLTFFIMETNKYCLLPSGLFVTSEVSVVAFSLRDGCSTAIHHLIDVGSIPMGYTREALMNSDETGIPLPPLANAETDMVKILAELLSHLGGAANLAPIYTMPGSTRKVQSFLEQICDSAGEDPSILRLFSLPKLLYKLRNSLCKEGAALPITIAQSVLERDVYQYVKGLACDMHEESDNFYQCSLSKATRWAFNICDHCCNLVGVKLKPGKHVPLQSNTDGFKAVDKSSWSRVPTAPVKAEVKLPNDIKYSLPEKPKENVMEEGAWPSISGLKISNAPAWGPLVKPPASEMSPLPKPAAASLPLRRPYGEGVIVTAGIAPRITPSDDSADWPQLSSAGRGAGRRRH